MLNTSKAMNENEKTSPDFVKSHGSNIHQVIKLRLCHWKYIPSKQDVTKFTNIIDHSLLNYLIFALYYRLFPIPNSSPAKQLVLKYTF